MKITELSTPELHKLIQASEQSSARDEYALRVLREEMARRLDRVSQHDARRAGKEVDNG